MACARSHACDAAWRVPVSTPRPVGSQVAWQKAYAGPPTEYGLHASWTDLGRDPGSELLLPHNPIGPQTPEGLHLPRLGGQRTV
jgi:hypothetical protein